MPKSDEALKPFARIDVNICSNTECKSFKKPTNKWASSSSNKKNKIECPDCGKTQIWVPNLSIYKVHREITGRRYLHDKVYSKESCQTEDCDNNNYSVKHHQERYRKRGKNKAGSQVFQCKKCDKYLSIKSTHSMVLYKKKNHKDKAIFKSFLVPMGIRQIAWFNEISPSTVYDKLEYFYEQCLKFNHHYDEKIKQKNRKFMALNSDEFSLSTNWRTNPRDFRLGLSGVQLKMLATCDQKSGFVLTQTMPFDSSVIAENINKWAVANGELDKLSVDRKYPEYLYHAESKTKSDKYLNELRGRNRTKVNVYGIKFDEYYHQLAHWYDVVSLVGDTKRITIYSDNSNYKKLINRLSIDGNPFKNIYFYSLRLSHYNSTVAERKIFKQLEKMHEEDFQKYFKSRAKDRAELANSLTTLSKKEWIAKCAKLTYEIADDYLRYNPVLKAAVGSDWGLVHPLPKDREPLKAISIESHSVEEMDEGTLTEDVLNAHIGTIDNYFQKIRRMSFFERNSKSAATSEVEASLWKNGKGYDPLKLIMMAEIFRTAHNFCLISTTQKKTPAMKLNLTKKAWDINDILTKKYN